jgi:hypothetical protein
MFLMSCLDQRRRLERVPEATMSSRNLFSSSTSPLRLSLPIALFRLSRTNLSSRKPRSPLGASFHPSSTSSSLRSNKQLVCVPPPLCKRGDT